MPSAFDTETHLIRPGLQAPPLVCLSSAIPVTGSRLFVGEDARRHFEWLLKQDPLYTLNGGFDMCVCLAVWPELFGAVFEAYDDSRVIDVSLSQRLIDNADGKMGYFEKLEPNGYSLAGLAKRILKKDRSAEKDDPDRWRIRYHELDGVPVEEYPPAAADYAKADAQDTLDIGQHQWLKHRELLRDSPAQARASFALQLMMCWGVMTDPVKIAALREASEGLFHELSRELVKHGLVRDDGTRNVRAAQERMLRVCREAGRSIKLTKTGYDIFRKASQGKTGVTAEMFFTPEDLLKYTSVDEDACNESNDDVLAEYSRRTQLHGIVHTHVPDLLRGVEIPIQPRYNTMVDSGRTSCSKGKPKKKTATLTRFGFQFQNPKRSLDYFPHGVGIRECFIARPGRLYADNDFTGLELHTGAQACIETVGYSELAKALNAGIDPHLKFAAQMMGISYEEAVGRKHDKDVKFHRQLAKVANFGFPGGLGVNGVIGFGRGYGVKLTREQATKLRNDWFDAWPEWNDYFKFIRGHIDKVSGKGKIAQLYVGRIRGGCTYTSMSNTLFQGLGADCSKRALYEVAKRCYVRELGNVLYGARPLGFIHDEILAEVFEELASEQAIEMAEVMVTAANDLLPDVPVRCEPALCKRWSKEVEAVYDEHGRLQPYDLARDGKWKVFYSDGHQAEWKEAA
jgi:hypothetical protein